MRLAILASAACIHTVRWANALAERGIAIDIISLHPPSRQLASHVSCHQLRFGRPHGYFLEVRPIRRLLKALRPDLLHVHYASGYGTLGRLVDFRPQVLSVWGSDVLRFPNTTPVHRSLIRHNLLSADCICSTSHMMAQRVCKLVSDKVQPLVVPFGVDTDRFASDGSRSSSAELTIGTVKTLTPTYGVDTLIKGFAECRDRLRRQEDTRWDKLRLRIVGDGSERAVLQRLVERLQISHVTKFVGAVTHDKVPEELNKLDVYVAVSRSESFGVAVIEASACERPVIVSDVGGLPEVVLDGKTGLVVPHDNPNQLAEAMSCLIIDNDLRDALGRNGRRLVQEKYEWHQCVTQMMDVYEHVLAKSPHQRVA